MNSELLNEVNKLEAEIAKEKSGCEFCGAEISTASRYWRRFCDDKCRHGYQKEAYRLGRLVMRERTARENYAEQGKKRKEGQQ